MFSLKSCIVCLVSSFAFSQAVAGPARGLLAEWNFDEGHGQVARDTSGNGHDAMFHGATWTKQDEGFVLSLAGLDEYVDCGTLPITGPVTLEAWVCPTRKANGEASLLGESMSSYQLTYYNTEVCCWYIGHGSASNSMYGKLKLGEWNHVVASFDGKRFGEWINGRMVASRESAVTKYHTSGRVRVSTPGLDLPKFRGMLAKVRVYDRALSPEEVLAHFRTEAGKFGVDPAWFSRPKVVPYCYPDRGEITVHTDYQGLQPLAGTGSLEIQLSNKQTPEKVIEHQVLDQLPDVGVAEVSLPIGRLAKGDYVLRVSLRDEKVAWPVEERAFTYPIKESPIPSPGEKTIGAMTAPAAPKPFNAKIGSGGGFELTVNGVSYPFESRISWPRGNFNRLKSGAALNDDGEKSWKVRVQPAGKDSYLVRAAGDFYSLQREISVFPTHVYVKDTYTNTTGEDLGLVIYNEMPIKPGQIIGSRLSGHEKRGRQAQLSYPDYSPSVFVTDESSGIGMVPMDDVYIVQAVPYVDWNDAAGLGTEKFALAAGKSYTLEWAIYPTASKDYYDFINTFRKVEGRIGTVERAAGFITWGPNNRRQVPDTDFIEKRGLKIGILCQINKPVDDPELDIEGIEFMDFPQEMELLKRQTAAIHNAHPNFKVALHIAHSLYITNNPDRFADSKVIMADEKQAIWGDPNGNTISLARQKEGWQQWVFYPAPGNSFHEALLKSVDVMMDGMGMDGGFMDGFMAAYMGQYTYDRWDEHSAEIDPATKTIKRKMGSVLLLSQPSLIAYARKIHDKGGVVISNNTVLTRSIVNEKYIIFDNECASGPELHMAPNVLALRGSSGPAATEKEIYLDMLDKLSWGEFFMHYNERIALTYPSLATREFPMTFEEIRSGTVKGKERIVTMNSGVYGWSGDHRLHRVFKFDDRGAPASHDYITAVDSDGVRTELTFAKDESAVIEPIPVGLLTKAPIYARVSEYHANSLKMLLNGNGEATLEMFVGTTYPDRRQERFKNKDGSFNPANAGMGTDFHVTVGGTTSTIREKDGTLAVPMTLDGPVEVVIEPANQ